VVTIHPEVQIKSIIKSDQSPNELAITICFENRLLFKDLLKKVIELELYGFDPELMDLDYVERNYDQSEALELINDIDDTKGVIYKTSDEYFSLIITTKAVIDSPLCLIWTLKSEELPKKMMEAIEQLVKLDGFICAYIYDYWDEYWQSATYNSDFEVFGKKHAHLRRIENRWGELVVDTTNNFGKLEVLRNVCILAAPIMYFDKWYFENICSKDVLVKNFKYQVIDSNILRIVLSENIFKVKREDQKRFLQIIDIDTIRQKYSPFG